MNDIELKQAWKKLEIDKEKINFQSPNLKMNMEQEIIKFEQRVNARDRREIITASILVILFTIIAIMNEGSMRIGAILLIFYFVWVIFYLTKAKNQKPTFSISKSIKNQLIEYKSYVVVQRNLVKNVLYWYILPIFPGVIFCNLNMESRVLLVGTVIFNILLLTYVFRLNQRAAKENYDGILKNLDDAILNLEVQPQIS